MGVLNVPGISDFSSTVEGNREVSSHSSSPVGVIQGGPHRVFRMRDPVFKIAAFAKNSLPFAFSSMGVHENAVTSGLRVDGERWPGFLPETLYRELQALGYKGVMPESFHVLGTGVTQKQLERVVFDLLNSIKKGLHKRYRAFAQDRGYLSAKDMPLDRGKIFDSITELKSKGSTGLMERLFEFMSKTFDTEFSLEDFLSIELKEYPHKGRYHLNFQELMLYAHYMERNLFLKPLPNFHRVICKKALSRLKKIMRVYFNEALSESQRAERILKLLKWKPLKQVNSIWLGVLLGVGKQFKAHITREMLEKTLSGHLVIGRDFKELRKVFPEKQYDGIFQG